MSFLIEFWDFIRARRKFWLLPGMVLALVIGALVLATKGSIVAPFIYTMF